MAQESTPLLDFGERARNPSKRIGVPMAATFVVGTISGSGIVAIPQAIVDTGWIGVPVFIFSGILSAYTGVLLGKCWTLLQSRHPEYALLRVTDPYPMIGFRAAGKAGEYATRFCVDANLFGAATVSLLLIADNITHLMRGMGNIEVYACYVLIIVWCFLTPLSWLGTPKDFWQAGIIAAVTISIAALLIVVGVIQDAPIRHDSRQFNVTVRSFFNSFGTFLYSFGGASGFPTIQVDMANPARFPLAVVVGTAGVLFLYLPAGILGFVLFGNEMKPNVLYALSHGGISYAINILITAHLIAGFTNITNPTMQEFEGFCNVHDRFTLKRILPRTAYTTAILFIALTIPHFNVILSLVGGSVIACNSFIFPPLFYYLLSRQKNSEDSNSSPTEKTLVVTPTEHQTERINGSVEDGPSPLPWVQIDLGYFVRVYLFAIIAIGVSGGCISTYFSISSIVTGKSGFTVPWYVNITVG